MEYQRILKLHLEMKVDVLIKCQQLFLIFFHDSFKGLYIDFFLVK